MLEVSGETAMKSLSRRSATFFCERASILWTNSGSSGANLTSAISPSLTYLGNMDLRRVLGVITPTTFPSPPTTGICRTLESRTSLKASSMVAATGIVSTSFVIMVAAIISPLLEDQ